MILQIDFSRFFRRESTEEEESFVGPPSSLQEGPAPAPGSSNVDFSRFFAPADSGSFADSVQQLPEPYSSPLEAVPDVPVRQATPPTPDRSELRESLLGAGPVVARQDATELPETSVAKEYRLFLANLRANAEGLPGAIPPVPPEMAQEFIRMAEESGSMPLVPQDVREEVSATMESLRPAKIAASQSSTNVAVQDKLLAIRHRRTPELRPDDPPVIRAARAARAESFGGQFSEEVAELRQNPLFDVVLESLESFGEMGEDLAAGTLAFLDDVTSQGGKAGTTAGVATADNIFSGPDPSGTREHETPLGRAVEFFDERRDRRAETMPLALQAQTLAGKIADPVSRLASEVGLLYIAPERAILKRFPGLLRAKGFQAAKVKTAIAIGAGLPPDVIMARRSPETSMAGFLASITDSPEMEAIAESPGMRMLFDGVMGSFFAAGFIGSFEGISYLRAKSNFGALWPSISAAYDKIANISSATARLAGQAELQAIQRGHVATPILPRRGRPEDLGFLPGEEIPEEAQKLLDNLLIVPTDQVMRAPDELQFKSVGIDEAGVDRVMSETIYNPDFAGVISVFRRPKDGLLYVVDGHQRDFWAKRDGFPFQRAQVIDAETFEEARLFGAMQNIANGNGSALDAAKIFREQNLTPADIERLGINLNKTLARQGFALRHLPDDIFLKVINQEIRLNMGVELGNAVKRYKFSPEQIRQLVKRTEGRTAEHVAETARVINDAGVVKKSELTLFGQEEWEATLIDEYADLGVAAKRGWRAIGKRLREAAKKGAGQVLETHGVGIVTDPLKAKAWALYYEQIDEVFDSLSKSGPVAKSLRSHAEELAKAKGKKARNDIIERFIADIEPPLREELTRIAGEGPAGARTTPEGFAKGGAGDGVLGAEPLPTAGTIERFQKAEPTGAGGIRKETATIMRNTRPDEGAVRVDFWEMGRDGKRRHIIHQDFDSTDEARLFLEQDGFSGEDALQRAARENPSTPTWPFRQVSGQAAGRSATSIPGSEERVWQGTFAGRELQIKTTPRKNVADFGLPEAGPARSVEDALDPQAVFLDIEIQKGVLSKVDAKRLEDAAHAADPYGREARVRYSHQDVGELASDRYITSPPKRSSKSGVNWTIIDQELQTRTTKAYKKGQAQKIAKALNNGLDIEGDAVAFAAKMGDTPKGGTVHPRVADTDDPAVLALEVQEGLFGTTRALDTSTQGELLPRTLIEEEANARERVAQLKDKVVNGTATREETRLFVEAQSLINRAEKIGKQEQIAKIQEQNLETTVTAPKRKRGQGIDRAGEPIEDGPRSYAPESPNQAGFVSEHLMDDVTPFNTPADALVDPESLSAPRRAKIMEGIIHILQNPIREGKHPFGRMTLGVFKIKSEAIRLRWLNDIEVAMHEAGHAIHKLFWGETPSGGNLTKRPLVPFKSELEALSVGISAEDTVEGMAEFIRRFVTNPAAARKRAPRFYKFFTNKIKTEYPELRRELILARQEYRLFKAADPQARIRGARIWKPRKGWSIADAVQRAKIGAIDDLDALQRMTDEITVLADVKELRSIENQLQGSIKKKLRPLLERRRDTLRKRVAAGITRPENIDADAITLARLARGSALSDFETHMEWGTHDLDGNRTGKAFKEVMAPLKNDPELEEDFWDWAMSMHGSDLRAAGKETGMRAEDMAVVLARFGEDTPKGEIFRGVMKDLQDFQSNMLSYMAEAGVITPMTKALAELKWPSYIPFHRLMDDSNPALFGGKQFGEIFTPIKRLSKEGSGREIIHPREAIVRHVALYSQAVARQGVSNALHKLAQRHGSAFLAEIVSTPRKTTALHVGEVLDQLRAVIRKGGEGLDDEHPLSLIAGILDEKGVAEGLQEDIGAELLFVFRPGDYFAKDNMISFLQKDGRRVWMEVEKDIYTAMMGLDQHELGAITKILSPPARLLRAGATLNPSFQVGNPIRDQFAGFLQSEYGYVPFYDLARGLFHMARRDDLYWKWKMFGGEFSTVVDMDRATIGRSISKFQATGGQLRNVVLTPFHGLQAMSAFLENGTRMGEFLRAVEKMSADGVQGRELYRRAAAASKEVSVDFSRHGASFEAVRLTTAFWNAHLQGLDKMRRTLTDPRTRKKAALKATMGITLPSVILYGVNRDDPGYWKLPDWERAIFWHVRNPQTGGWIRIPKPFEWGIIFGTSVERMLEWMETEDTDFARRVLGQTLLKDVISDMLIPKPTALLPLIENTFNKSIFLNRELESQGLRRLPKSERFRESTSEFAKGLSKFLGGQFSPIDIDNLIFGYTAGLGRLGVGLIDEGIQAARGDEAVPKARAPVAIQLPGGIQVREDFPGLERVFSKSLRSSSDLVERMHRKFERVSEIRNIIVQRRKDGEREAMQKWLDSHPGVMEEYKRLASAMDEMNKVRARNRILSRNPQGLSSDELTEKKLENANRIDAIAARALGRNVGDTDLPIFDEDFGTSLKKGFERKVLREGEG